MYVILEDNLLGFAKDVKLWQSFTVQQDNNRKYTTRIIIEWYRSNDIHILDKPKNSTEDFFFL